MAQGLTSLGKITAGNMQKLTWDEDLAKNAQNWADQCTFEHDDKGER